MTEFSFKNRLQAEDYYYSEEGYLIFTEQYHLKRGYCCENGCKHCPYGYRAAEKKKENSDEYNKSAHTKGLSK